MAERNAKLVTEQISQLSSMDGNFYSAGLWKVKNKVLPRPQDPPMAKRDVAGNLITAPLPLKKLYMETYQKRLEHRPIKFEHKDLFELKTLLWGLRYEEVRTVKSSPWTMDDLMKTVKGLKNNQTRDPSGLVHALFKPGIMGQDLAIGLLDLLNGIKFNLFIPVLVQLANITSIFKNKGSRQDLKNDRGIFILSVIRKILDKMVYRDEYDDIDHFMSDSNIGARKKRNVRNHLFVVWTYRYMTLSKHLMHFG